MIDNNLKSDYEILKSVHRKHYKKAEDISFIEDDFYALWKFIEEKDMYRSFYEDCFSDQDEVFFKATKMINLWEVFKLTKTVVNELPWTHHCDLQKKMILNRIEGLDEEIIENIFSDDEDYSYKFNEVMKAVRHGLGIQQVYGSWQKMAEIFYKDCEAISDSSKKHFKIEFLRTQSMCKKGRDYPEQDWKKFVTMHIINECTPDIVNQYYEALKDCKDNTEINEIYDFIYRSGLRMDRSGRIIPTSEINVVIGDQVINLQNKSFGEVVLVSADRFTVKTADGPQEWIKDVISKKINDVDKFPDFSM